MVRDVARMSGHSLLALLVFACITVPTARVSAQVPGKCAEPATGRADEVGCYLDGNEELGELPQGELFWHIYNFPTRAAAEAVKGKRSTVIEAFGKVWLYTIADEVWAVAGGTRVSVVGPLNTIAGKKYTARYMEATFTAGMRARVHRHSGIEAFYLLTGAQCLETPDGVVITRAGESHVVPAGPLMTVQSVGSETRRSIVLVLHDSAQPWQTLTNEWTPSGSCQLENGV